MQTVGRDIKLHGMAKLITHIMDLLMSHCDNLVNNPFHTEFFCFLRHHLIYELPRLPSCVSCWHMQGQMFLQT